MITNRIQTLDTGKLFMKDQTFHFRVLIYIQPRQIVHARLCETLKQLIKSNLNLITIHFFIDSLIESESLSSGVGTSSHSGSAGSSTTPTESQTPSLILPGMHVVCLENFSNPELANGLHITQGDIIEGKFHFHGKLLLYFTRILFSKDFL